LHLEDRHHEGGISTGHDSRLGSSVNGSWGNRRCLGCGGRIKSSGGLLGDDWLERK